MTKNEILSQLRAAKTAHMQWLSDALALISGMADKQNRVPVAHTDCEFGKWYYGGGRKLAGFSAYGSIEVPHELLHRTYSQIFRIHFSAGQGTLLAKLFPGNGKLSKRRQREADDMMQSLLSVSRTLLESIALLETAVQNATDEELEAL